MTTAPPMRRLPDGRRLLPMVVVALLVLAALLGWAFWHARSVVLQEHFGYTTALQDLRKADAAVNAQLMAARLGWVHSYDALNARLDDLMRSARQAAAVPSYLDKADRRRIEPRVASLAATLARKADLVDRFRRDDAVARNSLVLFPELAGRLSHGWSGAEQLVTLRYVASIHELSRADSDAGRGAVRQARGRLQSAANRADQRAALALILSHGDLIVATMTRLGDLGREVMELPVPAQIDAIDAAFRHGHEAAEVRGERYRRLLLLLALGTGAALGFTLLRLERTRRQLQRAHGEVSERLQAQLRAEADLRLHATAFMNSREGITLTDANRLILDVNPAFTRITGYAREEVIGRDPRVLKSGRHDSAFYREMWRDIELHGNWRGEIWNRNKFGVVYPELLSISSVKDNAGTLTNYVAIFSDISRLKEQERQLTQMAYYDPLTGLPNRTLLLDRLQQALAYTRRTRQGLMAVCYLDLDGFKPINDTHGHEAGDHVLVELAERLTANARASDTVARLGGDEFVLLLLNLEDRDHCHQVLQRLQATIALPLNCLPVPTAVTASIGVTLFPHDDGDADTLLRHADQAMYTAKQSAQGGYVLFDPAADRQVRTRQDGTRDVAQALQSGQLELHYQPKVDLQGGQVVGVEALTRWNHPQRGQLAPDTFLPLIENTDLVVELGQWVIEQALQQVAQWERQGLALSCSVNVASRQLEHPDFLRQLRAALSRHPHAAARLELEVLESTALQDFGQVTPIIEACQAMGVNVALDDFGTGYSSLTYLKRLPVRSLKVDRSFVRDMVADEDSLAIVQGVIGLARSFQRRVVAEGVEGVDHGRMLLLLGCDHAQGSFIAPALPAGQLPAWVAGWQAPALWQRLAPCAVHADMAALLQAEVRHVRWVLQLVRAVRDGQPVPSGHLVDPHGTAFGRWYDESAVKPWATFAAYAALAEPQRQMHQLVRAIDDLWRQGRHDAARALVKDVEQQRDRVLAALRELQLAMVEAG